MIMINGTTVVMKFCNDGSRTVHVNQCAVPILKVDGQISDRFLSPSSSALWQFKP